MSIGVSNVTFKDDVNQTRKDVAPQSLAVARRIALNMVKNEKKPFPKKSAKKRLRCTMDINYRKKVFDINFKN